MASKRFRFAGSSGQSLDGTIDLAEAPERGTALFAHCFTCGKQSLAATRIAAGLAENGWSVLRFDFTGLGGSEGEFANSGFNGNVEDLVAAAAALGAEQPPPTLLVGHSLGGAAMIAAAGYIASCRAVATINAPFDVEHLLDRFGEGDVERVEQSGQAKVRIGGREFCVTGDFIEQVRDQPQAERLGKLGKALMVMHAPTDELVALDNAKAIFDAARHPKSFVALDGADHLLTTPGSGAYAARIVAAWAQPYGKDRE
ncbi:MAG: alpha/beta hydrolase family protein [Sphingomicrobium sp.]